MITFPNAKINLGLNITGKRSDGYHNLETVFYPVPFEDALEIVEAKRTNEKFTLRPFGIEIPGNMEENLVAKAYAMLDRDYGLPPIEIHIFKHIPLGAGLGGGSADAAFMLKLLNEKFNLHLSHPELEKYAAGLGADCAFFINNRPIFAEGIGNEFSPVALSLKGYQLILVKPPIFVSTREAFSQIKPHAPLHPLKTVINYPLSEWKKYMINDFEESVFPQYPAIGSIKEKLYKMGAIYASMSGSGSSVYGVFDPDIVLSNREFGDSFYFQCTLN